MRPFQPVGEAPFFHRFPGIGAIARKTGGGLLLELEAFPQLPHRSSPNFGVCNVDTAVERPPRARSLRHGWGGHGAIRKVDAIAYGTRAPTVACGETS